MISTFQKIIVFFSSKLLRNWLALFISFLLLFPSEVSAAKCSEICTGTMCPTSSYPTNTDTLFWWPSTGGNLTLSLPSPTVNRTYIAYSTLKRVLTINGTSAQVKEIFVGSPGTSDSFRGFGGANTYVIGGASSSVITGSPDAIPSPVYTSVPGESDKVRIDANPNPDYVHINGPIQVGGSPYKISIAGDPLLTPLPPTGSPTAPRPFRGSGELLAACTVSWNGTPNRDTIPRLASMTSSWPSANDTFSKTRQWFNAISSLFQPNPFSKPTPFPGVASIAGIDVSPASADHVFLPAEEYSFNGRLLSEIENPPIVGIRDVRFGPSAIVDQKELEKLVAESQGLPGIPTDIAPLIYFEDEGLLVSSLNSEPLGTSANPGKPIVRLLDRRGRPQALTPDRREGIDLAPNQTLYQSTFLVFEPSNLPTVKTTADSPYSDFKAVSVPSTAWMITGWIRQISSSKEWPISLSTIVILLSICGLAMLRWFWITRFPKADDSLTELKVDERDDNRTVKVSSTI